MSGQDDVAAFLRDPATHGGADVTVEETHISLVVLAGGRVFKMKKAVDLGFLDFSTLEARWRACDAEVRLNRRTAPGVYRGVVPVTRQADGALALGGPGAPVEWLVEMRRLPADMRLDTLAARGGLTRALAERLADAVAALHSIAAPAPGFGAPAALRSIITDNIALARRHLPAEADALAALERESLAALARAAPVVDARIARGCVRRCHGDLHLKNVFVEDGAPVLFDCIEFNDLFACIDTAYDLAFLLMDLWSRGMREAANAVLNRIIARLPYAARAEALDMLALLPLHLSMRACVRAKVESLGPDPGAASAYVRAALDFLRPPPPRLIAVGGLQGTGKSTLARALALAAGPAPGALILRSDELRKSRFGAAPEDRLPDAAYTEAVTAEVYAHLRACAGAALAAGHSVIADAMHLRPDERTALEKVAAAAGAPFAGFWLEGGDGAARIAARRGDASDATPEVRAAFAALDLGPVRWTRLDAGRPPDDVAEAARAALP